MPPLRDPLPDRHHPVHRVFRPPQCPLIVFLSVCTENRKPWLASPAVHEALRQTWQGAGAWLVGTYVVMPDHVHLFVTPSADAVLLANWVRYWKSQFTRKHGDLNKGWQSDYWDRTLRSNESYAEKRDYVLNNPVRKGLVIRAEDWPYRGDLNELLW